MRMLVAKVFGFACAGAVAGTTMPAHQSFDMASAMLHETRHINVYVPPVYDTTKTMRFPVLYMPDGGMQEDFPHVATDLDTAIRAGQVRPMIVIGIENTERRRDMTGPTDVASDRKIAPHVGGSAAFRAFIASELMPEVRRRYRTNGHTAIVGESLAGLFVVETFLLQPDLFDTYVALSPSLWWNDQSLLKSTPARLKAWPASHRKTLYFATSGDDDIANAGEALATALSAHEPHQVRWFYVPRPDLQHSNIYVRASPEIFRKLFPAQSSFATP
ncbi:alpha/beta hydrolase-fold protein [Rhodanobacter sp. L36]|uniref:alpha/beta hydrolase n=1 Tax=Rhodanobacter sp. L36 TaxID=1747221 RepID=UPI00131B41EF|nr:alpha/beta hydrolase-fold protein [Rhodanobacter sp. L36]